MHRKFVVIDDLEMPDKHECFWVGIYVVPPGLVHCIRCQAPRLECNAFPFFCVGSDVNTMLLIEQMLNLWKIFWLSIKISHEKDGPWRLLCYLLHTCCHKMVCPHRIGGVDMHSCPSIDVIEAGSA